MRITIEGVARRGITLPELKVPARLPVTVDFDSRRTIGTATCERHEDGTITATAELDPQSVARLFGDGRIGPENMQELHPFLGVQSAHYCGIELPGIVTQIAVIGRNADDGLPRYRVTVDLR